MSNALFTIFVDSVLDTSKFDKGWNSATQGVILPGWLRCQAIFRCWWLVWSFNRANAQAMQFGQTMADVAAITELNVDKIPSPY